MDNSSAKLFDMASTQMGHFTPFQAECCGINRKNHTYYVKTGHWKRVMRGIYRLVNYPVSEREDLMIWYLWARNRNDTTLGVISHETALDIYELSDNNSPAIHFTVPTKFKRFNSIPKIIKLHKMKIKKTDISSYQGMKITTPIKTLIDLASIDSLSIELLEQAIKEALRRGLVLKKDIMKNKLLRKFVEKN
jgi:predicted transcriptional regulator of viral defense system